MGEFKEMYDRHIFAVRDEIDALKENEEAFYKYFDDVLDVEYRVDYRCDFLGAYIWVEIGGPTTYIDTLQNEVVSSWGGYKQRATLDDDVCRMIEDYFEEHYNTIRGR